MLVLTAKALTNEESDALEMTLPVLAYGVKQKGAGSGVAFSGTAQNQWTYNYPAGFGCGHAWVDDYGCAVSGGNGV